MSDDARDRLIRLEQKFEHTDKTLDRLAETQEQLVRTVSQIQVQQGELNEIRAAMHMLDKRSALNERQIVVIDGVIATVGELRDQVKNGKFIERILTSIASAMLTGAVGLFVYYLQSAVK
jgi:dsDNA-specific endonuclease/ATPase MutS2